MTEIKLDASKEVGWRVLPDELRALSCGDYDDKDMPLGLPTALRYIADAIEEQVKPAVEEPQEFGSIVRAGRGGSDRVLWQHAQTSHYWLSETGIEDVWPELTDVEVLRVGLRDIADLDAAFEDGAKEGARQMNTAIHSKLVEDVLPVAIANERRIGVEKAIQAVEELAL